MRLPALIALISLTACTSVTTKKHPYAEANALMRREIQSRIENIQFQHNQELLNNLLWLQGKAGELAIPDLLDALHHKEAKLRSSAAWVLGRIRDRRVIPQLQRMVSDSNDAVRYEAARSLVSMGDLKYSPILIEGLDSEKVPVRYNCHMALRDSTNRDFEYDHLEDDIQVRREAVLRWRQWWAKQSGDPRYATNYAKRFNLGEASIPAVPLTETKSPTEDTEPWLPESTKTPPKTETAPKSETPPKASGDQPKPSSKPVEKSTPKTGTVPPPGSPLPVVELPRIKG